MRITTMLCVVLLYLAGCGSKGDLYLPEEQEGNIAPVSIRDEGFQPEVRQQELQPRQITPQEEEEEE